MDGHATRGPEQVAARAIELARELIRIPSYNPPGAEQAIAERACDVLRSAGIEPLLVPLEEGRPTVVARLPGREPGSVILCGHLDTVRAEAADWASPPLEPRVESGRLFGLGAADMKSGVALLLALLTEFAASRYVPPHDLVLLLTVDEEVGYRGAASVAESGLLADARALIILEPTGGEIYAGQKGELWLKAEFEGREAHGSIPESGVNAVALAARFIEVAEGTVAALPSVPGRGRTTLNVGRFQGGRQVNIVPGLATLEMDVRVVADEHAQRVRSALDAAGGRIAAAAGGHFTLETVSYHPPIATEASARLARQFAQACGRPVDRVSICPYSTDAVALVPALDVPVLIYGPGHIQQAHRPNESIALSDLEERARDLLAFLTNL